ncbi:DUF4332 domain-containing protein [Hyphomicrobium sp.]|uniref:DUF4332 domain-containing protein n=1 Tax=Hyphomicrobium sp. TaxID=82 RepID=UPI002C1ABCFF|nr:DUF4332 domain-containing protein [Hyphomicrobium sp.]HRN90020.1 DUF4332 domain-containing protein [Hyphomicrobium sp.]HRQ26563.1 DUF4332 domain-containing protein [Hyphomicrobium sp.]
MSNRAIEDLEGIGKVIGGKLRAAKVKDTAGLLAAAKTPRKRKSLSEKSGLSEKRILKFANMADLYRIEGIGSEFSELLEKAGVDTVPELAQRNAAQLARKLASVNRVAKLTRRVPSEKDVSKWIKQAKTLPRMLEY